jgi:hypothetical protein
MANCKSILTAILFFNDLPPDFASIESSYSFSVKSCCPANKRTKREYVKELISKIGEDIPQVRDMMFTALIHPERYNLFDKFERDALEID